ncbi:chaplin [Streptomyces sp. NPDC017941]|uniref:chaplin n=1 Tax=Streptomyces sp. NPDC017941 TaxID=3365018 RepID=UPI003795D0DC
MRLATKCGITAAAACTAAFGSVGAAVADAGAQGAAVNSPGVLTGGLVQIPVHIPVNLCGGSTNVVGLLNPAFGNVCVND